jgi:uncharacterized protein
MDCDMAKGIRTAPAKSPAFRTIGKFIVRHKGVVIVAYLAITVMLAALLPKLNVIVDNEKILPQEHHYVQSTNAIEDTFGFKQTAVILVRSDSGDALEPWFLDGIARATEAVRGLEGVRESSVLSLTADRAKAIEDDGDGLLRVSQLVAGEDGYADRGTVLRRLSDWPVFDPVVISKDRQSAAIIASFANDPLGFEHQVGLIEAALRETLDPRQTFEIGGHPSYISAIERYSGRVAIFFGLAVILIGILHYDAFRTWQGVALPIGTGIMAVIWVMGLISILNLPLDSFNATAPLFIFAVAAGHSVQLLKRYYEELASIGDDMASPAAANHEAIIRSLERVGPVLLAAGLVGAGSFLSLLVFSIETIRVFGVVIALGILSAIVVELGFMTAVRACFLPRQSPSATIFLSVSNPWDRLAASLAHIALHRRGVVIVLLAYIAGVSVFGIGSLKIDNSYLRYFAPDTEVRRIDSEIRQSFAGASALYVMLDTGRPGGISEPGSMATLCRLQAVLGDQPAVNKTLSFCDYVRRIDGVLDGGAHGDFSAGVPQDLIAQYLQLYRMSGGPEDLDYLIDSDAQRAVVIAFRGDDSTALFQTLERHVRAEMQGELGDGVTLSFGGNVAIGVALNDTMVADKITNIAQIGLILCLLSAILFRSLIAGVLVVAPLAMTVSIILGIMGLFDIPLQIVTVSIVATAVGIGSDYAIYWLYRFREELSKHQDVPAALNATFRSAGQAVIYVATSVTCGYAMLMLSLGFRIHLWLGLMVSLSMAIAAIATLTLLPALALLFRPKFLFGSIRTRGAQPTAKLSKPEGV